MLLDQIKKDNLQALKEKNKQKRAALNIIINKFSLIKSRKGAGENTEADSELLQIIRKTIKELDEISQDYKKVGNEIQLENILTQKQVLEDYLPKTLSENEIIEIIDSLDDKSIGNVMKHFKVNYSDNVDMSMVNRILRKQL